LQKHHKLVVFIKKNRVKLQNLKIKIFLEFESPATHCLGLIQTCSDVYCCCRCRRFDANCIVVGWADVLETVRRQHEQHGRRLVLDGSEIVSSITTVRPEKVREILQTGWSMCYHGWSTC